MASDGKSFQGSGDSETPVAGATGAKSARKTTVLPVSNAQMNRTPQRTASMATTPVKVQQSPSQQAANSIDTAMMIAAAITVVTLSAEIYPSPLPVEAIRTTPPEVTRQEVTITYAPIGQEERYRRWAYGSDPDRLYGVDLRQNITRAEFAALSVRVYENISGNPAPFASMNPFYDTSDPEVLKAALWASPTA